jgi:hypothetical protein
LYFTHLSAVSNLGTPNAAQDNLSDRSKVVSNAISYHEKGSIIAFQYHMIQPDLAGGSVSDAAR